jgi:hypothetical protein
MLVVDERMCQLVLGGAGSTHQEEHPAVRQQPRVRWMVLESPAHMQARAEVGGSTVEAGHQGPSEAGREPGLDDPSSTHKFVRRRIQ